jgi:hypothetical protein
MKRNTTIARDINKKFPPTSPEYPICYTQDDQVFVSAESTAVYKEKLPLEDGTVEEFVTNAVVADYYGEFRGGYPWIEPWLENYAELLECYWEWQNAGAIVLVTK